MNPPPLAIGLMLCRYVHFEEGHSRNASLVGCFSQLGVERFPASPLFYLYTVLTNAAGGVTLKITVDRLDTGEEIYAREGKVHFPGKLSSSQASVTIRRCSFPKDGWYQITLFADGQWVAERRFRVYQI